MPQPPLRNLDEETVDKLKQNGVRINTSKFWEDASQIREKLLNFL